MSDPIVADIRNTIGVDIGGTTTRIVAYAGPGTELAVRRLPTPKGASAIVDRLCEQITTMIDPSSNGSAPASIGVGIPGVVHSGRVDMALNIGVGEPFPLATVLAERLGAPVVVENDVNAAALGAHHVLAAGRDVSLAFLNIGTGFAAGVVANGEVLRGVSGTAGEIGHVAVPGWTTPCGCGQVGCLETVVSGRAIRAGMREYGLDGGVRELWQHAASGSDRARRQRDDVVDALAWACQLVTLLLDVDSIVVGGGVGAALGDELLDPLRRTLRDRAGESVLLANLDIAARISGLPPGVEVGALGADLAGRASVSVVPAATP
jgi:predicted NBD/HSP70 family sugar kinase